jgi:hypothetical protein
MKRRHLLGSLVAVLSPQARALYDPQPMALLRHLPGRWHGSLTYRDWSPPHGLVSLPCDLFAALKSPSQASLYFVFQDGPAKVVHSYDRWTVSDAGDAFTWASGKDTSTYDMAPAPAAAGEAAALLTRQQDGKTYRQRLRLSAQALHIEKVEVEADGRESFRNRYEFVRGER